ncbi:MAG: M1 family metallopeptidase [Bacteroidia bacterium]
MKISIVTFFTLAIISLNISAQSYFQQEVNYTINVRLDDVKHELTADESIEYINNAPAELTYIYMHLWPNAYKDNTTPMAKEFLRHGETDFYYAKDEERGYIDQLDFKVDGQPAKWELLKDSIDICKLYLNKPLKTGEKIIITTPFRVKIPSGKISRLGHIDQSYQITQWYPKPAVFDKNGWNYMPYLTQGEFYSEFGSFDVSITLPKNYVLGATGDMVNGEKELEWLNEKVKATQAITSFNSKDLSFLLSDTETKTLRFKQKNVHDFAWFCDKRYHVLKGEVETPHTKHKVTTWVMFTNAEADLWKKSISYINDAVYYYSLWNGDYPYNHCTAVDGTISAGGGMEYPNITVIGTSNSALMLDLVIAHEVGHNWFYGMLGSNERVHPWLDEGLNSFNELRYVRTKYPNRKLIGDAGNKNIAKAFDLQRYTQKAQYELGYLFTALKNEDQPIELEAYNYTQYNYGGIVYYKTAVVFDYLMAVVGEKEMEKAMQHYFDLWHFKHPQPADLKKALEESTGKDFSWFFDDVINTTKKIDFKIKKAYKKTDGSWNILVKNKGGINGSFFVQALKNGEVVNEQQYEGFEGVKSFSFPASTNDYDKFKIDYRERIPEINRKNNSIKTHGVFKKIEPLKLQLTGSLDNPDKTQLFYSPIMGWNNYNRWMLGAAFYNHVLLQKKFEFEIAPMYSFGTKDLSGYGRVSYTVFPDYSPFKSITFAVSSARFAYTKIPFDMSFNKIAPELNIRFKKQKATSKIENTIKYRNISILNDAYSTTFNGTSFDYKSAQVLHRYNDVTYQFMYNGAIHPFSFKINIQEGGQRNVNTGLVIDEMVKASLTAIFKRKFKKHRNSFDVRVFAGSFIATTALDAAPYRFRLSGQTGYQDYLYDNIYLGRTETTGILANQFTETDGGFKFYSTIGQTGKWIAAVNLKSSIANLKLPVKLYADIGTTADDGLAEDKILYNAGLCLSLSKNTIEVYFPLLLSNDFRDYNIITEPKYIETVRFTLNLNLLNPFDIIKNIDL